MDIIALTSVANLRSLATVTKKKKLEVLPHSPNIKRETTRKMQAFSACAGFLLAWSQDK